MGNSEKRNNPKNEERFFGLFRREFSLYACYCLQGRKFHRLFAKIFALRRSGPTKGFTLLEAIIALAIWMIVSLSVVMVWQHVSSRSEALLTRQNAFERARGSLDALIANIELAQIIQLHVGPDDALIRLTLTSRNRQGTLHDYVFRFNANARPGTHQHHRLLFGGNNEFASGIAMVRVTLDGEHAIKISIETNCRHPVVLTGSVDIRYKQLIVL